MAEDDIKFVIDIETTGLDYRREKIIEIAAVKMVNNEITDKFESLVNPMQHIRHSSINIHGITEEMILEAPTIEEILPQFLDFIEDKPIIGHNVIFDYSFLNQASLSLYGKELVNNRIDTLQMFKEVFPDERSHGLTALLSRFNATCDNHHRALADAYSLATVYDRLNTLYEERYSWQISQLDHIHYLFERYLRLQNMIQTFQSEMGDIKSVFKIYFERNGDPVIASTGEVLTYVTRQSYQYDVCGLREVLDELDMADKVLKLNVGVLDKMINGHSLDDDTRQKLLKTRLGISESTQIVIQKPDKCTIEE